MSSFGASSNATKLREMAEHFLQLAKSETDPQLKRGYAGCAFAVSQLAESIATRAALALAPP